MSKILKIIMCENVSLKKYKKIHSLIEGKMLLQQAFIFKAELQ